MKKLVAVLMMVFCLSAVSVFAEEPLVIDPETQSTPIAEEDGSPAKPSTEDTEPVPHPENPHH